MLAEGTYDVTRVRAVFERHGYRSLLAVPLLFEERIVGVLVVWGHEPARFAPLFALYRQAVNGAPLSVVPRLKLAQAYQKDGLSDRALDEARRALEVAPDSVPVQQFLSDLDQQTGTSVGTLIRVRAALELAPNDPAAHAALADALAAASRLVATLKHQKKEKKALTQVWSSLKALNLGPGGQP